MLKYVMSSTTSFESNVNESKVNESNYCVDLEQVMHQYETGVKQHREH